MSARTAAPWPGSTIPAGRRGRDRRLRAWPGLLALVLAASAGCYDEVLHIEGREPLLPRGRLELEFRKLGSTGQRELCLPFTPEAWAKDSEREEAPTSFLFRHYIDVSSRRVRETVEDVDLGSTVGSCDVSVIREEAGIFLGVVSRAQVFRIGGTVSLVMGQVRGAYQDSYGRDSWHAASGNIGIGLLGELSPGFPPLRFYAQGGFTLLFGWFETYYELGGRIQVAGLFFQLGYRRESIRILMDRDLLVFSMDGPVLGIGFSL